jgi:hypothetical protein
MPLTCRSTGADDQREAGRQDEAWANSCPGDDLAIEGVNDEGETN